MRTTVDLPEELLRRAKARAALDGTTLKELMTRFVEEGLRRLRAQPVGKTAKRSEPPTIRLGTGEPLPFSTNRELQELLDREDIERAFDD